MASWRWRGAAGWDGFTSVLGSTPQEVCTVHDALVSFNGPAGPSGHAVKIMTDNQNTANIINKGAAKADACYTVAMELLWSCVEQDIRLQAEWRPRTMNQLADYWSKIAEPDDWSLRSSTFRWLDRLWGRPFDIDLFASHRNQHLPIYYSALLHT
ncbi:hypothetical protein GPECTOR_177g231 [Gonium pectorale]|uniref:RNase H type-1 domain-containing protein n=1 Tax=Gonium pectorale TaxID=33097 RepID=A0A150FXA6_GONPE|nr:hypothetical protein GPECTOR_177g231 [Gonium pectorale]|eukprot:KXZ42236.1 hypothetical protein GPECTOR_177g231 [Gonium pectorale]